MKIKYLILSFFSLNIAYAQVRLNVTLHPIVNLEIIENKVECKEEDKNLSIFLPLETFIVTQGEVLRFELLHLDAEKIYSLSYNDERKDSFLTREKPYLLVSLKRGEELHHFNLKISNTSKSFCRKIQEIIRLTLEPM